MAEEAGGLYLTQSLFCSMNHLIWNYFTTNEIKHKFEYIFFQIVIINCKNYNSQWHKVVHYANIELGLFNLSSVSYE